MEPTNIYGSVERLKISFFQSECVWYTLYIYLYSFSSSGFMRPYTYAYTAEQYIHTYTYIHWQYIYISSSLLPSQATAGLSRLGRPFEKRQISFVRRPGIAERAFVSTRRATLCTKGVFFFHRLQTKTVKKRVSIVRSNILKDEKPVLPHFQTRFQFQKSLFSLCCFNFLSISPCRRI